jgi:hypothetical protein
MLCSLFNPILTLTQQVIDTVFGFFSFLGIPSPDVSGLIGGILGCTA